RAPSVRPLCAALPRFPAKLPPAKTVRLLPASPSKQPLRALSVGPLCAALPAKTARLHPTSP
ncbi:MAG: hypothetical protein K2M79_01230, partial [Muribaculaceae bacterium]|nr:hypothetical protein [Muribaculaceae bacterium]